MLAPRCLLQLVLPLTGDRYLAPAAGGLSSSVEREVSFNVKPYAPVFTYVLACVCEHVVV